jgi:Holliday junction resolvase RusA-like endonuclease
MFVDAYPPDRRRRDLDNILKAILDALQHAGCYADDSQIHALRAIKQEPQPPGRVVVTICQHRTLSQDETQRLYPADPYMAGYAT